MSTYRCDYVDYYDPLHDEREELRTLRLVSAFEAPEYTDYDPGQDYRLPERKGPKPGRCPACKSPITEWGYGTGGFGEEPLYVFCLRCDYAAPCPNLTGARAEVAAAGVARRMARHNPEQAAHYAATNPDDNPPF